MNIQDFTKQFSNINNPILGVRLPEIHLEERHLKELKLPLDCSHFEFLRALCKKGFQALNLKKDSKEYNEYSSRVKYELELLNELGFTDYILLVWDVMNFCREQNIPTGPGRGSAAGSLVLYLIGVTRIDSLKYGLYFERFVSKTRAKKTIIDGITYLFGDLMPDVDSDFDYYRRPEVLKYIETKYKGKTCKILTLNTLSSKLLIKEVGKVLGMKQEDEMTMVTAMIPKTHGIVMELDDAIKESSDLKAWCDENPLVYDTAVKLNNLNKNKGVHPSGILISYYDLETCCPIELSSDKEEVSSYDMNLVSSFAVKFDALGLRSVSVIQDCCNDLGIKPEDIDVNDPIIYQNLQDLRNPHGLFQIEADLAYKTIQKVKPKTLLEISAVLALARPGAMKFIDDYAKFSNYQILPNFDIESDKLIKILSETGGIIIYQETLMRIAKEVFGLTLEEAELIRRACGKKKKEEMEKFNAIIKKKGEELKIPKSAAFYWQVLLDSASYSFNLSHSLAYSVLTAQTVYLKFKYPTQFFLSLLKMTKNEPDPIGEISKIHKEMLAMDIELLPPSLTLSNIDFSIQGKNIRFGLSSIKGISDKTMEKFNNFKRQHANKFELFAAIKKAGLGIGILSALISAGTLDSIGKNRVLLVYESQLWNLLKDREKIYVVNCAKNYGDSVGKTVLALVNDIKDENGKFIIKESRFKTIKKDSEKYKKIYEQNKISQDFVNWFMEKRVIGYTSGKKLIDIFIEKKSSLVPIVNIKDYPAKTECDFIGVVDETPKTGKSRAGTPYAKFQISDETGVLKVMLFGLSKKQLDSKSFYNKNDRLEDCKSLNNGLPKEGDVVIISGTKMEDDTVFAESMATQQNRIFTSFHQLKDS